MLRKSVLLLLSLLIALAGSRAGAEDSPSPADLDALWAEATLWRVGSNVDVVPAARQALIAEGERTLDFLIPDKLDSGSTLVSRGFNAVIRGLHAKIDELNFERTPVERLRTCLSSDKGAVRRNAADLLSLLGDKESAPAIALLLHDQDAQRGALTALARLGATETVPQIASLLDSGAKERVRCAAIVALASLKTEGSTAALIATLSSKGSAIRFAGQYALERQEAVTALVATLSSADRRARIHALMALGHLKDTASRDAVRGLLKESDSVLRGHAVKALAAMAEPTDEERFESMAKTETDPFVRTALREALIKG